MGWGLPVKKGMKEGTPGNRRYLGTVEITRGYFLMLLFGSISGCVNKDSILNSHRC